MIGFINEASVSVLVNLLSVLIGCLLAIPLFRFLSRRAIRVKPSPGGVVASILVSSVLGAIVPLGSFGIIPLVAVPCALGRKDRAIAPFVVANFIFNMAVPVAEPNFTWGPGAWRIALSVVAGTVSGLVLWALEGKIQGSAFRERIASLAPRGETLGDGSIGVVGFGSLAGTVRRSVESIAPFLVVGALLNVALHRFALYGALKAVYASPAGSAALSYMNGFDVTNPWFMLALSVAYLLTDVVRLSALARALKARALIAFVAYVVVLAALLASSIYFA